MKSEELFEALTDIDEDMIFKAKAAQFKETQIEAEYAEPRYITVTKRKFPRKAACAAMAVVIAAFAGAVILRNGNIGLPSQNVNGGESVVLTSAEYPEDAKYVYEGDFSELTVQETGDVDKSAYELYCELEKNSDLAVYGSFTDDARQTYDPNEAKSVFNPASNPRSYNKFKINKLIKGDGTVSEGDEIIISQDYAVYGNMLLTSSGLTPMIKNDSWFYFLTKNKDSDSYSATGDTDGRYFPDDGDPLLIENRFFPLADNAFGLYDEANLKQNICRIVKERHLTDFTPYVNNIINYFEEPADDMYDHIERFEMAEFPGVYFKWSAYDVKAVKDGKEYTLYGGMPVWDLYLADINGDGKREICSSISMGFGMIDEEIMAFDCENGDLYNLSDRGNYDFRIYSGKTMEVAAEQLYFSKKEYNGEETVYEPLDLSKMEKTESPFIVSGMDENTSHVIPNEAEAAPDETNETNETAEDFKIYEPFGMTYEGAKKGLYYNGKPVRWFEDYYPVDEDGNKAGRSYVNEIGVVDVYAMRDFSELKQNPDGSFDPSGRLVGLKEFSEEEFAARDINAIIAEQGVTHIAYKYDDSTAVETDSVSDNISVVSDDSVYVDPKPSANIEASSDKPMSEDEITEARKELLKNAEEYKPFGVAYDDKNDLWYYNGEKVRSFRDILTSNGENPEGGNFHGTIRSFFNEEGTAEIYTVRDFSSPNVDGNGTLIDIVKK